MSGSTSSSPPNRRRSSIVEMFNPRSSNQPIPASSSPPSATTTATSTSAPQHRRGVSISAMAIPGGSPTQGTQFNAFAKQRAASIATSSTSGSPEFRNSFGDEPAVIEEDDTYKGSYNTPATPFARRVSFGAQALRDVRQTSSPTGPGGGRRPSTSLFTLDENNENLSPNPRSSSGMAKAGGEGFNWSENLRDRSLRSPSFSSGNPFGSSVTRPRATSMSVPEPPKEMPKPTDTLSRMKKPDHLGERMLRGDFMMD